MSWKPLTEAPQNNRAIVIRHKDGRLALARWQALEFKPGGYFITLENQRVGTPISLDYALEWEFVELPEPPRLMAAAPKDGTMLRLLIAANEECEHPLCDTDKPTWTIGFNNFEHDGEDVWKFAGWCWSHDHFTEGKGTPIGWLPFGPIEYDPPEVQYRSDEFYKIRDKLINSLKK